MTIILDAMGSDKYPDPEIQGAIDAAREYGEEIMLVGKQEVLEPKLKALNPGSAAGPDSPCPRCAGNGR